MSKPNKKGGIISKYKLKISRDKWKSKAISQKKEVRALKKRVQELENSRDHWKMKYRLSSQQTKYPDAPTSLFSSAKHHSYPLLYAQLCLHWQSYGRMSLRACSHCLSGLIDCLGLGSNVPCHETIRQWVCQLGYHRSEQVITSGQGHQWVLIVDESVMIGQTKLLLVLGLRIDNWSFERPISISDVEVLHVASSSSWKGSEVQQVLDKLSTQLDISYVISDQGANLLNAYKGGNYKHIPDCSHVIASGLKKQYKDLPVFEDWTKQLALLRKKYVSVGEWKDHLPPKQRTKARFMNIFPMVKWQQKKEEEFDCLPPAVQTEIENLRQYKALYQELMPLRESYEQLSSLLKKEGFNSETYVKTQPILEKLHTPRQKAFAQHIKQYLKTLQELQEEEQPLLCCSDVIESCFGKYKYKRQKTNLGAMDQFQWCIANFGKRYTSEEIKVALEKRTVQQFKEVVKAA